MLFTHKLLSLEVSKEFQDFTNLFNLIIIDFKFQDLNLISTPLHLQASSLTGSAMLRSTTTSIATNRKLSTNIIPQMTKSKAPSLIPQQSISSSGTDGGGSKTDLMNLRANYNFNNGISSGLSAEQNTLTPFSHQVTSMNESKAKQVCKKRPLDVISHTETLLIRCYPNARRFDSSNFSPVHIWACGIQLAALNYQTLGTNPKKP